MMQDVIERDACSRAAFARARQRARGQRTRLAAPEQRGHFFNSFFKLSTISFYMGQQLEIFGLLLLLPRARRALARAETRARAAGASRARSAVREGVRGPCAVCRCMCGLAPPRAHGMQYVAYRHDTPHGMPTQCFSTLTRWLSPPTRWLSPPLDLT